MIEPQTTSRASLDKGRAEVAAMFDRVAKRYDLVNDVLSLGQDRAWRAAVLDAAGPRPGQRVLDLAAGTGTSSEPFAAVGCFVAPTDFSLGMLQVGKHRRPDLPFVAGDALRLPYADESFRPRHHLVRPAERVRSGSRLRRVAAGHPIGRTTRDL